MTSSERWWHPDNGCGHANASYTHHDHAEWDHAPWGPHVC